jgi:hypothetical protein
MVFLHASKYLLTYYGVPEGIRTPDRRFRKPLLYPAELPGQFANFFRGKYIISHFF